MTDLSHDIPTQMFAERTHAVTRYRSVSMLAVASLACGGLSFLGFLHPLFFIVPLLGLASGYAALRQLRGFSREMIGMELAWGGMAASVTLGLIGWLGAMLTSNSAAPAGYAVLTFEDLQPAANQLYDPGDPGAWLPKAITKLSGQKIFLRGFIYPTRHSTGLRTFILVRSEQHCSFCVSNIKSTDMVEVTLAGDLTTDYTQNQIGVGGRLKVNPEEAMNPMGGFPYTLEADCVR